MNTLKTVTNWMIATLFTLFALAFLAVGGLALVGRLIGGSPEESTVGMPELALEPQSN